MKKKKVKSKRHKWKPETGFKKREWTHFCGNCGAKTHNHEWYKDAHGNLTVKSPKCE